MTLTNIFRIIKRDTLSLITNMTGLSLGLAVSILLTVFILYELSFDRHFTNSDRIYRINTIWEDKGEANVYPISARTAFTELPQKVAGVESSIQIYNEGNVEVLHLENRYKDLRLFYSDPDFFKLFDLKFIYGNAVDALSGINEVVLTEALATRIFGTTNAVGEAIEMDTTSFMVSAVIEDIPANTHFSFDMIMPMKAHPQLENYGGLEFFTYYMLNKGVDHETTLEVLNNENARMLGERFADFEGASFSSSTESVDRLHLHSKAVRGLSPSGSVKTILIMLVIAILVLVLALSNFINLYILNGSRRSKEIGIRKVNGAGRPSLVFQFYMETTVVVTLSFLMAALLSFLLIPEFSRVMQRDSFISIVNTPVFYLVLLAVYLVTILLSGFYPALLLSKADPVRLFQGSSNPAGDKQLLLKIASVFQISVTLFMLTTLLGIFSQTRYLKQLSPGYDPEGIVVIYNLNDRITDNYLSLKESLANLPGVVAVAGSGHTIGAGYSGQGIRMFGQAHNQSKTISEYRILAGLCELYRLNLIYGRFFDPERTPDRSCIILNEAAVEMLGYTPGQIVGETVTMWEDPMEVIGVVEDFHYTSAAQKIEPLMLNTYRGQIRNIAIRLEKSADPKNVLEKINETIKAFDKDYIMIHRFATDLYDGYYEEEVRLQNIVVAGSLLSVVIVLLGIYALVSHNIISRTKEIGIRKVMGGSTTQMVVMIYTSTLKWTIVGAVIGLPLSYLYLSNWLQNYAIKTTLHWWIFAGSIVVVALFETLITLGQTWKTARKNPVKALRYE